MALQIETPGVHATRRGNGLHRYVDGATTLATAAVLTDATLYYNIPAGKQVLITGLSGDLDTNDDDVSFYLVKCSAVAGGGDPVQLHGEIHVHTPAAQVTHGVIEHVFNPPILVIYEEGSLSISVYADANDDAAEINLQWQGWVEEIT